MIYLQALAGLAAVVIAAGPQLSYGYTHLMAWLHDPPATPDTPVLLPIAPNYQTAMQNLSSGRLRLLRTDCLTDEVAKAVATLTLALMDGSEK